MTLRIGTPVRWPNPPLGWRRGVVIDVIMPRDRPDHGEFASGRRYRTRNDTSYLVRENGPGGRILWPNADHLEATGEPPAVLPLTVDELAWCVAHPDLVRQAIGSATA